VNFPLPMFLAKDEQFVVRFFRRRMGGEDLGLSSRSGTSVSQVAHLHDFVDRENDAQFEGLENVLVARLHRFAANEGVRIWAIKIGSLPYTIKIGSLPYSAMAAFVSLALSAFS